MHLYLKSLSVLRAHRYECITIAHVYIMPTVCQSLYGSHMPEFEVWYKNKYIFLHFSWVLAINMIVNIVKKYFVYKTVERTNLLTASVQHYEKLKKFKGNVSFCRLPSQSGPGNFSREIIVAIFTIKTERFMVNFMVDIFLMIRGLAHMSTCTYHLASCISKMRAEISSYCFHFLH